MRGITFQIPVKPVPKQSTRFANGRAYQPKKIKDYEQIVALHAKAAMRGQEMLKGPIELDVLFIYSWPSSWSKKKRKENGIYKLSAPDVDNLLKGLCDPLNGIVWEDDKLCCKKIGFKQFGLRDKILVQAREMVWS